MSGNNNDDDDKELMDNNMHVFRECNDLKQTYSTYQPHETLLLNLGYQLNTKEDHTYVAESSGWFVCMWSIMGTLDLVWRDMDMEGAEMRFYYRREGQEFYHITLPFKRSRTWVIQKIFIPEQIVYIYPIENFNSEFILPNGTVDHLATVQRANTNRLLWDHLIRNAGTTSLSDDNNTLTTSSTIPILDMELQ